MDSEDPLTGWSVCKYSIVFGGAPLEREGNNLVSDSSCSVGRGASGNGTSFSAGFPTNDSEENLDITLGTIDGLSLQVGPSNEQFDSLVHLGSHSFAKEALFGVSIWYVAPNEVIWRSDPDVFDQTGSLFEILEIVPITITGTYILNTRMKFKCNLYNDSGEVKICEGTATGAFQSY